MSVDPRRAFNSQPGFEAGQKKRIKLALQGGGAYGAYSAGAVISLLQDPKIEIVEITGTSAGEKIALIVADRINKASSYDEGRDDAIQALLEFKGRLVRESAPMMHALEIAQNPMDIDSWRHLFTSSMLNQHSKGGRPSPLLAPFDMMRSVWGGMPFATQAIDLMEAPWKHLDKDLVYGSHTKPRKNANLPGLQQLADHHARLAGIFETATSGHFTMVPRGLNTAYGSLQSASAAVATETLRNMIGDMLTSHPDPRDPSDRVFTHAASGRHIKVFINTAKELPDGSLVNCVHTGNDLTLKRSMGSSALKGFFEPSIINGERHWDGGYTENTSLSALADSKTPCDGVFIIGTNRPVDTKITPMMQRDLPAAALDHTKGLVWHQMYAEAVLRAESWKPGQPTWHMITYNHAPENDWTAKQNTCDWHIRSLLKKGQIDCISELSENRTKIGIRPTISREKLQGIALEGEAILNGMREPDDSAMPKTPPHAAGYGHTNSRTSRRAMAARLGTA